MLTYRQITSAATPASRSPNASEYGNGSPRSARSRPAYVHQPSEQRAPVVVVSSQCGDTEIIAGAEPHGSQGRCWGSRAASSSRLVVPVLTMAR